MASNSVTMSKKNLAAKTQEARDAALTQSVNAEMHIEEGAQKVQTGRDVVDLGRMETAAGVSDLTRAEDAAVVASRVKTLSDVVGVAGVVDVAEGAEMLATSEDVGVMSAMVGLMGEDDLETGSGTCPHRRGTLGGERCGGYAADARPDRIPGRAR